MRIREYEKLLKQNLENLITSYKYTNQEIEFTNLPLLNETLSYFESNGIAIPQINKIRETGIFNYEKQVTYANPVANQLFNSITEVNKQASVVLGTIQNSFHFSTIDENVLSIKFNHIKNFSELNKYVNKLKKSIDLPVEEFKDGGEVKILNFDSGSFWIDILLPTTACVSLVASIAWAGAVIYKKYQEAKVFKSYAESVEISKEYLGVLADAAEKKVALDVEMEALLIYNQFFHEEGKDDKDKNDQLGRLKLSIKEYSELIGDGVQIQPSLAAPEQITNLFPNYKALELISSKVKEIGDGK